MMMISFFCFFLLVSKDILDKLWGWDKLLPIGDSVSWADYSAYLEEYLRRNDHAIGSIPTVAQSCLNSEEQLVSEWKLRMESEESETWPMRKSNVLSCLIHECVRPFIDAGCSFSDVSGAALLCIAKEADLTSELLRCGVDPLDDYLINQGREIRTCALSLMNCTLDNSVAASAVMLGMAKEADMMRAWISKNNKPVDLFHYSIPDEIEGSRIVRYRTLNVMIDILEESSSAAAAGHKIDKKEPASRNCPVGDGDGIAADGAANTTGRSFGESMGVGKAATIVRFC